MEPLFLHYNTGLHISENGKLLSQSIQQLVNEQRRLLTMEKKDDTSSDRMRLECGYLTFNGWVSSLVVLDIMLPNNKMTNDLGQYH
jgi:hypothetical protein